MEIFANLVGVTFHPAQAKEIVKSLTPDDGDKLALYPEPDNAYDPNAVKVYYAPLNFHIGYLARENNYEVFQALERGKRLKVEIAGFENTIKPTLLITDIEADLTDKIEIEELPYKPSLDDPGAR